MKITQSQLKQIIKEELEAALDERYADDHGAEASFFADQPGQWGETPVEDQPELQALFSAADSETKQNFVLANSDLLQAYDKAAGSNPLKAKMLLRKVRAAWREFSKGKIGVR
tara:strand:- start:407 stop:745 length:339 start_codon:yes stop_codon:yes gene_type:complete